MSSEVWLRFGRGGGGGQSSPHLWRTFIWILLPLILLGGDYLLEPVVFENKKAVAALSVNTLLERGQEHLGTFRGHSVVVTLQPLFSPSFRKTTSRAGLVISHFVHVDSESYSLSLLGRVLLDFLSRQDPSQAEHLKTSLDELKGIPPGGIHHVDLGEDAPLPYRDIFMVFFEAESPEESRINTISKGMKEVYRQAAELGVEALYVPCLTYRWEDQRRFEFGDFFDAVLMPIPSEISPRMLFVALYSEYPSFVLEDAAASLNRVWDTRLGEMPLGILSLHRSQLRMILVFLSLSLAAGAIEVPLTPLKVAKIAILFLGMAEGASALLGFVVPESSRGLGLGLRMASMLLLAIFLPRLSAWNYRNVFRKGQERR